MIIVTVEDIIMGVLLVVAVVFIVLHRWLERR